MLIRAHLAIQMIFLKMALHCYSSLVVYITSNIALLLNQNCLLIAQASSFVLVSASIDTNAFILKELDLVTNTDLFKPLFK